MNFSFVNSLLSIFKPRPMVVSARDMMLAEFEDVWPAIEMRLYKQYGFDVLLREAQYKERALEAFLKWRVVNGEVGKRVAA